MAKKSYINVMLVSEDNPDCKFRYYTRKTIRGERASIKLRKRKYNPVTKKHEWFVEKKLPSHSKK